MRLFSGRTAELKTMNRILTESARQRAERVEELERALEEHDRIKKQLYERIQVLDRTLLASRARVTELEGHNRQLTDAATARAARIQDLDRELQDVRTECAGRVQDVERELLELRTQFAVKDFPRLEAERAFYCKRMQELEEHNQQLTEAATKYARRAQELEKELSIFRPELVTKD